MQDGRQADGVKARVLERAEIFGLADLELDRAGVRTRDADPVLEGIDTDDDSVRPHSFGNPPRQAPCPASDVEHARARLEREPLDQALASFELEVTHPIVDLREMPAVVLEGGHLV